MIHVLTIHWKSDDWIDIQLNYLKEHISRPFKVYTFLNDVPNYEAQKKKFFYASNENIKSHPIKLNLLADMAAFNAQSEDDLLLFLDGDAFPINSIDHFIDNKMGNHPLAAVQRLENNGDTQPHPCFCICSVKFWKKIQGDWKAGDVKWLDKFGKKVWDVGGIMLKKMEEHHVDWLPLTRSNHHDLHPLLFGVYDDLIYHHGAAFRNPGTRVDRNQVKNFDDRLRRFRKAKKIMPRWLARKLFLPLKHEMHKNKTTSEAIYKTISSDPDFYKKIK